MAIKNKMAEMSGILAALLIAVVGLALVGTVFSFSHSALYTENETGVWHSNTNVTSLPGAVALITLVGIIFIIIIVYAMIKKVQ